jgi:hypothetical protein
MISSGASWGRSEWTHWIARVLARVSAVAGTSRFGLSKRFSPRSQLPYPSANRPACVVPRTTNIARQMLPCASFTSSRVRISSEMAKNMANLR